jgi:cytochrome P450
MSTRFCARTARAGGLALTTLLLRLRKDPLGFLTEAVRRYGDLVFLGWVSQRVYLVNHPEYIRYVLQENAANYTKGGRIERLKPLFGKGLTTSDGELWRRQHELIQPLLRQKDIAALAPLITATTSAMLERWREASARGRLLDIAQEMRRLTQGIMARAIFGQELLESEAARIGQASCGALEHINKRVWAMFHIPALPTSGNRALRRQLGILDRFVSAQIAEKRSTHAVRHHLLGLLLASGRERGSTVSDRQLRDETLTLFVAGHTTLAAALAWTWYLLSRHPAFETRLSRELQDTLGGRIPRFEDLANLSYTRAVITEVLRLYPPTWILARSNLSDDEIGGHPIPAHSVVLISPYLLHRHRELWPNASAFDPTRFTAEAPQTRSRYAYLPFGTGPRVCLGKAWALMELQLILATVAERCRLRLAWGSRPTPEAGVVMRPRGPIMMGLEMRGKG